jgi:hypothetical protein
MRFSSLRKRWRRHDAPDRARSSAATAGPSNEARDASASATRMASASGVGSAPRSSRSMAAMRQPRVRAYASIASRARFVDRRIVGVQRLLHQQPPLVPGQQIEEAEAARLRHIGVHQQRHVEAVFVLEHEFEAEELLDAGPQPGPRGKAAAVDDAARLDSHAVLNRRPVGAELTDRPAEPGRRAERHRQLAVKAVRRDRPVAGAQRPPEARETHFVVRPRPPHERRQPGVLRGLHVCLVERPGVPAPERWLPFDEEHGELRATLAQAPGNQAVREAAADEQDVAARRRGHGRDPAPEAVPALALRRTPGNASSADSSGPMVSARGAPRTRLAARRWPRRWPPPPRTVCRPEPEAVDRPRCRSCLCQQP